MAQTENPGQIVSREAGAAIDALRFLKKTTGNKVTECTAAGEQVEFVSRYDAASGTPVACQREGDLTVEAGGNIAADAEVMTGSDGRALTAAVGLAAWKAGKRVGDDKAAVAGDHITVTLYQQAQSLLATVGAAIASVAGVITPTARKQHVTGALAITGITATGFADGDTWTVIPDGAFTWTNATNIAVAGTAVVNRQLDFVWDATAVKWYPSYV